jgi:Rieske Fe-S protein
MDDGSVRGSLSWSRARRALLKVALGLGMSLPLVQPAGGQDADARKARPHHGVPDPCHFSTFDVKDGARVLDGPAPRRLPALPLRMVDGVPAAAGGSVSRVGFQQGG